MTLRRGQDWFRRYLPVNVRILFRVEESQDKKVEDEGDRRTGATESEGCWKWSESGLSPDQEGREGRRK